MVFASTLQHTSLRKSGDTLYVSDTSEFYSINAGGGGEWAV